MPKIIKERLSKVKQIKGLTIYNYIMPKITYYNYLRLLITNYIMPKIIKG